MIAKGFDGLLSEVLTARELVIEWRDFEEAILFILGRAASFWRNFQVLTSFLWFHEYFIYKNVLKRFHKILGLCHRFDEFFGSKFSTKRLTLISRKILGFREFYLAALKVLILRCAFDFGNFSQSVRDFLGVLHCWLEDIWFVEYFIFSRKWNTFALLSTSDIFGVYVFVRWPA